MLMKKKVLNKKIYSKPQLEVVDVDYEISLVMMTGPPDDGGGGPLPTSVREITPPSGPIMSSPPSSGSSPFGGESPDYD